MPECRKCRVTYLDGESHNCRGLGQGKASSRSNGSGAGVDFLLAWIIGAPLGGLVSAPVVYLVRSETVLAGGMLAGVFVVFIWRRMRQRRD
jgi:hypothetical protein